MYLALDRIAVATTATAGAMARPRPNPNVTGAVVHGSTLDEDDDSSKQTLTKTICRSRTVTRCHPI